MEDLGAGLVVKGAGGSGADIGLLTVEKSVCCSLPLAGADGAASTSERIFSGCFTGLTAGSGRSAISSPDDASWKKIHTKCEI